MPSDVNHKLIKGPSFTTYFHSDDNKCCPRPDTCFGPGPPSPHQKLKWLRVPPRCGVSVLMTWALAKPENKEVPGRGSSFLSNRPQTPIAKEKKGEQGCGPSAFPLRRRLLPVVSGARPSVYLPRRSWCFNRGFRRPKSTRRLRAVSGRSGGGDGGGEPPARPRCWAPGPRRLWARPTGPSSASCGLGRPSGELWGGGAAGQARTGVPSLGLGLPFHALVRVPRAGVSILGASASWRVGGPAPEQEGRQGSGAFRCWETSVLSALPSSASAPHSVSVPGGGLPLPPPARTLSPVLPGISGLSRPHILSVPLGPLSASQAFQDPLVLSGYPQSLCARSHAVLGLPGLPSLVKLASLPGFSILWIALCLLTLPSSPILSVPVFMPVPLPQLCQGSPILSGSPILLVTYCLTRVKPIRTLLLAKASQSC